MNTTKYIALLTYCYKDDTSDKRQSFALQAQSDEEVQKELKTLILSRFAYLNSASVVFLDIKIYQLESALGLDFKAIEDVTNSAVQLTKKKKEAWVHDIQNNR